MDYIIKPLEKEEAIEISNWKYEGIYAFYSHSGTKEEVDRLLNGCYYSVKSQAELIGYFCFGTHAQVPSGQKVGAYDDVTYTDIGLGMRPDLTNGGRGSDFVLNGIEFARSSLSLIKLRLTVAQFNERAIKAYTKAGFKKGLKFDRVRSTGEVIPFMVMYLD